MKRIKVTQIGSSFGRKPGHKACVSGLGLRRRHHTVELEDTPAVRGMIRKVAYLLKVQEL
ncbi:MAG: 50S ribosomal protein L30 [Gammaproteobacteria bacterium]|nr:MAG: 50S ribosomal protein L30 [Gammaproteobacteria bacterium]RKZ44437.1 MAG: 50S ribosomal protein L30 [Gammaproteobacteria bacterium]RKZ76575.1 MAG: 50S ribosomal protein L30 [Gammaproteobacteria bacterium]